MSDVEQFAAAMARAPRELRAELRPAMRAAGGAVRDAAASNASWSRRIPASLRVSVLFGARTAGVVVKARSSVAPHAKAYEGRTGATFRHPVFGDRDVWVTQSARPFLRPALASHRGDVVRAAEQAIQTAFRRAGIT